MNRSPAAEQCPQNFRLSPFVLALRGATLALSCSAVPALAQPTIGTVPTGGNVITQGNPATIGAPVPDGNGNNSLTVTQSANFAHIEWDTFNIAAGSSVSFTQQPEYVVLNQVMGVGADAPTLSQIYGTLSGAGTIALINPAGVMIGPSGIINVGGLIASSLAFDDVNVVNGGADADSIELILAPGDTTARVISEGGITAGAGGVTLIGRGITTGTADAADCVVGGCSTVAGNNATIQLLGADGATLSLGVPVAGQVRAAPSISAVNGVAALTGTDVPAVLNNASSTLQANSGQIILSSTADAPGLLPLVNNSGLLIATGVSGETAGGTVQLIGIDGVVTAGGTVNTARFDATGLDGAIIATAGDALSVGALNAGDTDGTVTLTAGAGISTLSGTTLTTSALTADGGAGAIQLAESSGVTLTDISNTAGDITVTAAGPITATSVDAAGLASLTSTGTGNGISVVSVSGANVTLNAAGAITDGNAAGVLNVDSAGLLTATAGGAITLDTAVGSLNASSSSAGDITIRQTGAIDLVDVDTANGAISITADDTITATDVATAGTDKNISIEATAGNIEAGTVEATGNVSLLATTVAGQQILDDESGTASTTRVTGNLVTLTASSGIGTTGVGGADVDTAATTLSANVATQAVASAGDVNIDELDGVIIANLVPSDGDLTFTIGSSFSPGDISVGGNNLSLATRGTGSNLTVGNLIAGAVTLDSAGTLGGGTVAAGSLNAIASGDISLITAVDSLDASSSLGSIGINDAGALAVGLVSAGNSVSITAGGNITDGRVGNNVSSPGLFTVTATGGSIDLDTAVVSLNATAGSGALNVRDTGGITLTDVDTAAGSINITSSGDITATDVAATGGSLSLSATGGTAALNVGTVSGNGVTLNAAGNITDGNAAGTNNVSAPTGLLTANSGGALGINLDTTVASLDASITNAAAGGITIRETDGIALTAVDTAGGSISVTANTGGIQAGAVGAGSGDVSLNAVAGAITDDGSAATRISGDLVTLTAASDIGAAGTAANTSATTLVANAGAGSITLEESGAVTLDSVDAAGSISIAAAGTITASDVESSGSTVTLTASSGGNIAAGRIAGSAVTLSAAAITDGNGTGLNIVSPAGLLSATATSGISLDTQVGSVTATGGNGAVSIREADDLSVVSVSTTNGNSIALTAGGAIADGAGGVNVATSGQFTANAVSGIDLDTNVGSLDASVSGSGNLVVREANAITLTDLDTANGSIIVSAGGTIAASNLASITDSAANDITLTASAGNIVAGTIDAGGSGGVTLLASSSGGQILDDGNDGAPGTTRIRGDVVTLTAGAGIGAGDDVDTDANTLAASTGTGPINVDELDGLTISALTTVGGDITLSTGAALVLPASISGQSLNLATRDTGANLTVNGLTAVDTVTLSAAGAILDGNGTGLNVSATTLSATASSGIELDTTVSSVSANGGAGAVTIRETNGLIANGVSGSNVTLSAGGAISGAAGVDVTTDGLFIATAANGINLDTSVAALDGSVTGGGDLVIRESDGLAVVAADAASGNISVTSASGNILVGAVAATAGNVTLSAQGVGGQILDDGNDDAPTTTRIAGNLVALSANAGIGTEAEDVDTDATTLSAITVSGPINIDELNAVTATTVSTGAGGISLSAGDLTLGSVTTPGAVVLSAGGSILDANGTGTNVSANSLNATAGSGIDLDTAVANLSASVSGAGNIVIAELNDLVVDTVQAGSGSVTLSTGGDLSPGSISGTGVTLDVGGGLSFATTDQVDGGAGAVVIETAGGIVQDREREGPAVIGSSIAITAGGNVGELTVPLEVDSGGGTVIVNFNDTSSQGFISGVFGSLNESSRVLGLASNSELSGTVGAIQSSFEKRVSFNLDSSQFSTSARIFATEGTAVLLPEDQRE